MVTESLVKVDQQNMVKVLIENHENHPVFLEAGTTLGFLQPVKVVNRDKLPEVLHLKADSSDSGNEFKSEPTEKIPLRSQQLLNQLDI